MEKNNLRTCHKQTLTVGNTTGFVSSVIPDKRYEKQERV